MAETLARASAFKSLDLALAPLTIQVPLPRHRFIARGDADTLDAALGFSLPCTPCRATRAAGADTLWLGPDEWLLLSDEPLIAPGLVDISHRQSALHIGGPHVATALNIACPLDLDLAAFPVDGCTRTLFGKAEIVLWRLGPETFHLEIARSFISYVVGLLREATCGLI